MLAAVVLGEVLRKWEVVLVLLSLGGRGHGGQARVPFRGRGEVCPRWRWGWPLWGPFLSAGAYVATKRLTQTNDPLVIVFYFALVTVVGSLPFNLASFTPPDGWEWVLLVGVGCGHPGGPGLPDPGPPGWRRPSGSWRVGYLQIVFAALLGMVLLHRDSRRVVRWPGPGSSSAPPSSWAGSTRWRRRRGGRVGGVGPGGALLFCGLTRNLRHPLHSQRLSD